MFDPSIDGIDAGRALELAELCERRALGFDPRLKLSEGATFSRSSGISVMVLSSGFSGAHRSSYASLSVAPVVEDEGGKKRRGHYWTGGRHFSALEAADAVGEEAARRTLGKLGARKVPTTEAPVVFDPDVARSLVGSFAGCILGGALWRKSSYLLEREGTEVASPLVTLVDDPLIPRAPGSRAFDGEGLASRKNLVVEAGVLKTFLLDGYSARKLGRRSTGSASRSGGSIGPSTTNFHLLAGNTPKDELVRSTPSGLYVTELMGFGFNALTGDFSRGAAGFWIEQGQFAFPVSEITISSNLDAMLKGIDAVGDDSRAQDQHLQPDAPRVTNDDFWQLSGASSAHCPLRSCRRRRAGHCGSSTRLAAPGEAPGAACSAKPDKSASVVSRLRRARLTPACLLGSDGNADSTAPEPSSSRRGSPLFDSPFLPSSATRSKGVASAGTMSCPSDAKSSRTTST